MGLSNPFVTAHMSALFGDERAEELRQELEDLDPSRRELMIVEKISEALKEMGGQYVLPFCFKNETGARTSHYLIFVSKNVTGYTIMKGIMGTESSKHEQGVPSFSYCAADSSMPVLFDLARPLDDLKKMLRKDFAGRTLSMENIFNSHHVGLPYLEKNYKDALRDLEVEGQIEAQPSKRTMRKGVKTFANNVMVTFPPKKAKKDE